jgi:hypothetical protein
MRAVVALAGVALLLAAYVFWIEPHRPSSDQTRDRHRRLLARFDRASIRRIAVRRRGRPAFVIERQPPGSKPSFRIMPGGRTADDAAVEDLLTAIDFAETERSADVTLAAAGLAPPAVSLAFEGETGSQLLDLGNPDATGRGVFVALGDDLVRVAPRRLRELSDRDPGAFRDLRLVPLDPADVRSLGWTDPSGRTHLVTQAEERPWSAGPDQAGGRLGQPPRSGAAGHPVMGERVEESLRHLAALRVVRFAEPPPEDAPESGRVQLVANGPNGEVSLTVTDLRCAGGDLVVVARQLPDGREGTCLDASAVASLWPSLERAAEPDPRLLHSPPDSVTEVEVFDAQRRLTLKRGQGGWVFVTSKPTYGVDAQAVAEWLEALHHARCGAVPDLAADRHLRVQGRYREGCDLSSAEAAYPLLVPDPLRFRDRAALSFARIDARRLRRVTRGESGGTEVVSEDGGPWRLVEPTGGRIDRAGVDRVLGALADLRASSFAAEAPPGRPESSLEIDVQGPGDRAPVRHTLALFAAGAGPCTARLDGETTFTIARAACDELRLPLLESAK